MKTATQILFYILQFLTFVGDITLFVLKIPLLILRYLQLMSSNSWRIIKYKSTRIKKRKKIKAIKIFPLPVAIRIKYFLMGSIFSLLFFFIPLTIIIFLQELPNPKQLNFQQTPLTTKIFDRNGVLLYQIYAQQNRTLVPLSSIPKHLQQASIAIEDKNFYKNSGIDITAIVRAAIADISGKPLQGGSTITQQLIKSTLLTPEISIKRKIKEIILAFWADRIYTKDQILEMYFNQAPYGGTARGIEAASEVYFNLKASDLDLAQSAFLAGITRAPTNYSPFGESPNSWKTRQEEVLTRMEQLKYISLQEKNDALKEDLIFSNPESPIYAPHFVMYVKDLLVKKYGLGMVEKGGLHVTTSLDLKTQDMAQKIVTSEVEKNAYLNLTNGAAIVTNPGNGDILALVGSKDYSDPNSGNFNVTTALRQPGSSIKTVTYSAALNKGFTAATILEDAPITFTQNGGPSYSPVNYDGRFHGPLTIRQALSNSVNIPAVKILNAIGIPAMLELGKKMGITTWKDPKDYGLSITLGGAEVRMIDMATVYGVLANQGYRVDLNPILEVTDSKGHALEKKGNEKIKVLDEGVTFMISDILSDNKAREMEFGTNSPLVIKGRTVSVKTGTSDNKRDNWTIGYTPSYLVAVWAGNNDNSPMNKDLASGITGAAPIWNKIMTTLLGNVNTLSYKMPDNVVLKKCGAKTEYFIKGTETNIRCSQIATPSGMLVQPL